MTAIRAWTARTVSRMLLAVFVIPDAQVHQLDLEYQVYAFQLFHRSAANRLLHAIGLPISITALYAVLQPWPWLAVAVFAWVTGLELLLALRHRLFVSCPRSRRSTR